MDTITADQARVELEKIISEYPGRIGSISNVMNEDDINDVTCVYFTDVNGMPVNTEYCEGLKGEVPQLVTPVCIVGQWVQSFHPELKEVMLEAFSMNTTMSQILAEGGMDYPLSEEVLKVLKKAQNQQDTGAVWGNINLDL